MSWSVNANATPAEAKTELDRQFAYPLADHPAGLTDDGERETVRRIRETINQCLETFDPEKKVTVTASGHMGWDNYDNKTGAYQTVNLSISG